MNIGPEESRACRLPASNGAGEVQTEPPEENIMATQTPIATDSAAEMNEIIGDDATATFENDPKFIDSDPTGTASSENVEVQRDTDDTEDSEEEDDELEDADDDDELEDEDVDEEDEDDDDVDLGEDEDDDEEVEDEDEDEEVEDDEDEVGAAA
jgi:ribonuclease E